MEILNIDIPELIFIFLIMLIFLGPEGFTKTARGLARILRKLVRSPIWNDLVKAQRDIQELPTRLVREAGIEDIQQEMKRLNNQVQGDISTIRQQVQLDKTIAPPIEAVPVAEPDAKEETPVGDNFDYRAAALGSAGEPGSDGRMQPGEKSALDEDHAEGSVQKTD